MGNGDSKPASKTISRTDIQTHIDTEIKNHTENITNIMTKTINDTTMSVINKNATKIQGVTSATNLMDFGKLTATGKDSVIDINQTVSVNALIAASVNLVSDTKAQATLATQMASDLKNKVGNDNAMSASMEAINKIADAQKSAGGPEALVDSVMSTIGGLGSSLSGAKTSSEQVTMIKNSLSTKVSNTTINKNNISNEIVNKIKTGIENINEQSCELKTDASNVIKADEVTAGDGGVIKLGQSSVVSAAINCILGAVNASTMGTDIANSIGAVSSSDTTNANKTDSKVKTENDVSKTVEKGSAIMDSVDTAVTTAGSVANTGITTAGSVANNAISTGGMLMGMWFLIPICGICCCCFIVIAIIFMMGSGGGITPPSIADISSLSESISSMKS